MRRVVLVLFVLAACSSDSAKTPDAMVDAFVSDCGKPGDTGNELGIGHFCLSLGDCSATPSAPLCSSLGDPDTHFCTKTCAMGSMGTCGTGAECTCNSGGQCGCTPSVCLQ